MMPVKVHWCSSKQASRAVCGQRYPKDYATDQTDPSINCKRCLREARVEAKAKTEGYRAKLVEAGMKGGTARMASLTSEQRKEFARGGARTRWSRRREAARGAKKNADESL